MRAILAAMLAATLLPVFVFAASCPNLSRNLSRGMSGDDVKQLQQFLISQGNLESGFDTGFYGAKTEVAVQKFQCDQKLICEGSPSSSGWGSVGPRTRTAITSVCGGTQTSASPPPPASGSSWGHSCEFGGRTILNRGGVTAYKSQSVPFNALCESEQRTCVNGVLSGSYSYSFCFANMPASCSLDGATVYDGQFQAFYSSRTVQAPDACNQHVQSRECTNGKLSGGNEYQFASCTGQTQSQSGATTVAAPAGLYASCNAAGTQVTLSWNAVPGAASYGVRMVQSGTSTFSVSNDWYRGTTFTTNVSSNTAYSWWIHANSDNSHLGQYTVGTTFTCTGVGINPSNPSQSVSIDAYNVYSPAPVLFGSQPRLYFGGWLNSSQTHDNIYVADCPYSSGACTNVRTVLDSAVQGFEHLNDPSIVLHPATSTTPAYYIMYMTGVPAGESGFNLPSNKIYYSTSWATDGVTWSKPVLLTSGFWLPSVTMKNGHIELYANSTVDGRVAKFDLGDSGTEVGAPTYAAFDNSSSVPPYYSNVDVVWRPGLGLYQMVAERARSAAPGSSSVIDYLTSTDGISWHLLNLSIISADSGQFRVGTPAQWVDSAQWVYFGSTSLTNSMGFKIRFAQWGTGN